MLSYGHVFHYPLPSPLKGGALSPEMFNEHCSPASDGGHLSPASDGGRSRASAKLEASSGSGEAVHRPHRAGVSGLAAVLMPGQAHGRRGRVRLSPGNISLCPLGRCFAPACRRARQPVCVKCQLVPAHPRRRHRPGSRLSWLLWASASHAPPP